VDTISVVLVGVVRGAGGRRRDVPGQELDAVDGMIRDSGEHIRQIRLRIDAVEFRRSDETVGRRQLEYRMALDTWGNRTSQTPLGLATSKVGSQTLGYSSNKNTSFCVTRKIARS
jgi:hypothetical protein